MNQYLDTAIKAARAAGALVRENFGRPLKVNVEEAHDIKLELDVPSQALITDYQGTRAPINILKAEFDNLRASQPQILHKPKNGDQDFESSAVSTIETIATTRSRLPRFRFGSSFGVYRKIFIMPNNAHKVMPNNSQSDHRVLIERRQTGPPDRL